MLRHIKNIATRYIERTQPSLRFIRAVYLKTGIFIKKLSDLNYVEIKRKFVSIANHEIIRTNDCMEKK